MSSGSGSGSSTRVKAVIRVRPPFKTEVVLPGYSNVVRTVSSPSAQKVIVSFPDHFREFDYDVVLGPEFKQDQVYQHVGAPLVEEVLKGFSSTLLAYGQTGTGKTYTLGILTAPRSEDQGIVTRALNHIFEYVETHPENEWVVAISAMQIYKESIIDMLNPQHSNMALREDPQLGVFVEGLEEQVVYSFPDALSVINHALENRVMASTLMNATSSRSHTILKIKLQQRMTQSFEGASHQLKGFQFTKTVTGTLTLVDLAGSERIKKTNSHGERLEEAKSINVSLSTLGKVISALTTSGSKQPHIPFRDSKLTRLLQDSLGGNTNTTLIAAVGPSISHREETLSTLSFAMRCMKIKVTPTADRVSVGESDYADWCLNLQQQIASLQQEFKDKEAAYIQKIKSLSEQAPNYEQRDETPRYRRSNSVSSVHTTRSATPLSRPTAAPDSWDPSHDFLFFHYQLLQEIAQATVHLAQHTHAPLTTDDTHDQEFDELWAYAKESIDQKIASLHISNKDESTGVPFMEDLIHPQLAEFSEERELIIYLIQLRSLINSNLDFALHWMDTRQAVVSELKRQLILQEVEALKKNKEMEVWTEAMNQLIAENKQLRHALRSKKRDFRIAQDNCKLLKLRLSEMNANSSQSKSMANMKVPYITCHDLVRLDKAIRTLQIRFLGKRRNRVAKNLGSVRKLHRNGLLSSSMDSNSDSGGGEGSVSGRRSEDRKEDFEDAKLASFPHSASGSSRYASVTPSASRNGDGRDDATTFDDTSINESSIASSDAGLEVTNEKKKKSRNRRSLIHKLGGLFTDKEKSAKEPKDRSPQNSPDLENNSRATRSDSVSSDRSSSSMGSASSSLLESSITAQLLQHRLKLSNKSQPAPTTVDSPPAQRAARRAERSRNAEALLRKLESRSETPDLQAYDPRAATASPSLLPSSPSPVQSESQSIRSRASDAEALLRRMAAAHDSSERQRKALSQSANSSSSSLSLMERLQNATANQSLDSVPEQAEISSNKSTNPFSLSNFKRPPSTTPTPTPSPQIPIYTPNQARNQNNISSTAPRQPPPPSQYHTVNTQRERKQPSSNTKPPLSPKRAPAEYSSDEDFSQLEQFERELNGR